MIIGCFYTGPGTNKCYEKRKFPKSLGENPIENKYRNQAFRTRCRGHRCFLHEILMELPYPQATQNDWQPLFHSIWQKTGRDGSLSTTFYFFPPARVKAVEYVTYLLSYLRGIVGEDQPADLYDEFFLRRAQLDADEQGYHPRTRQVRNVASNSLTRLTDLDSSIAAWTLADSDAPPSDSMVRLAQPKAPPPASRKDGSRGTAFDSDAQPSSFEGEDPEPASAPLPVPTGAHQSNKRPSPSSPTHPRRPPDRPISSHQNG